MFSCRLDRLVILSAPILLMGVITACQQALPPQSTPDIPATVTAQVKQQLAQPTPTVPPTATAPTATLRPSATPTAYPTYTPVPTYTPYPTYTPQPTVTAYPTYTPQPAGAKTFPTPTLNEADELPELGSDGIYDLGFGLLMIVRVPNRPVAGLFSPRPARNILVFPAGNDWDHYEEWTILYVQLKCETFTSKKESGQKTGSAFDCVIVD